MWLFLFGKGNLVRRVNPLSMHSLAPDSIDNVLKKLPSDAKNWAENLPWNQRRYVLSLCHLLCAASPEVQAEFLDEYTANGLIDKLIDNQEVERKVRENLNRFQIKTDLTEALVRDYIRQFYVHSAQDTQRKPDLFLESALRIVASSEERNSIFNYILGFELIKMLFKMSWLEHERLYLMQRNQEEFIETYLKPIQHTHQLNQIVVPRDKTLFFARRDYFVQKPVISDRKLIELAMATFTTEVINHFGFSIIRHPQALLFDPDLIFEAEQDPAFAE
jgi:hypothetical protein